jgi:hypothetical protein
MLNNDKPVIGYSYPHSKNPNLKITDSKPVFERLIPNIYHDGAILEFSPEHIEDIRPAVMYAVNKLERHYGPDKIYTAGIAIDPQGNIYGMDQLPQEFGNTLRSQFAEMCRAMPQVYHPHLNLIASTSPSFLEPKPENPIIAVQPILISQWTASSGTPAQAANDEKAILKDGDWGYFQKGASLPKSVEDPALKIIVMPVYTTPDPALT